MKVPLSWLRDYVDLPPSVAELAERLTLAGLEVAGVRVLGLPVPEGLHVKAEDAGRSGTATRSSSARSSASSAIPTPTGSRWPPWTTEQANPRPWSPGRPTSRSATRGKRSSSPCPVRCSSTAMPTQKVLQRTQAEQDPRRAQRRHGLLGLRTGHLRRTRGDHPPGRRRPGRHAAGRLHGRHRPGTGRTAEHGPLPVDDRRGPRSGRPDRPNTLACHLMSCRRPASRSAARSRWPSRIRSCPRAMPPVCSRCQHRPGARLDAAAAHLRRHAAHQQHRGHHQLRHARMGPAAARLRLRRSPGRRAGGKTPTITVRPARPAKRSRRSTAWTAI